MTKLLRLATLLMLGAASLAPASRAAISGMPDHIPAQPLPVPTDFTQIPLAPGGAITGPQEQWDHLFGQRIVRNVTSATLTIYPAEGRNSGTAVVIVPGGGFKFISFDNEGVLVARWLAARGVTAVILKYRLDPTEPDPKAFGDTMLRIFTAPLPHPGDAHMLTTPAVAEAEQDGLGAIRWVRAHAAQYGINPHQLGIIGFSAGAMTAMNVATGYDAASRPDFVGEIYGAMPNRPVKPDAPPLFAAVAADDPLLAKGSTPIFNAWEKAGKDAELHIFDHGGHGFGLIPHGTSSDHWIDEFYWWLGVHGLTGR